MLGLNPSMRFYLCEGPVDMRKGIFTLAELVRKIMGKVRGEKRCVSKFSRSENI